MNGEKDLVREFRTEEEEAEYWDTHSPLDLGFEPEAQKVRVGRVKDRPITIRLDSASRMKLDRLAAELGVGPSTFARLIIMSAIERPKKLPRVITVDDLRDTLEQMPRQVRDRAKSLASAAVTGDPENRPFLLIDASQRKEWEQFTLSFLSALLAVAGVQVVTPEDSEFEHLKAIAVRKES